MLVDPVANEAKKKTVKNPQEETQIGARCIFNIISLDMREVNNRININMSCK